MTNLVRDENRIAALGGESTVSRVILPAKINATSGRLLTESQSVDSTNTVINPATSDNQTNGSQKTQIVDSTGVTTTPPSQTTTSEEAILLRRIVKLLESNAVVDISNRQRVTLDAMTNGSLAGIGVTLSGPFPNAPTIGSPTTSAGTTYWQPVWTGPVDQRFQIIDQARLTYNQGIRSHLVFT